MNLFKNTTLFILNMFILTACGGKYMVKSYPADAKLYVRDIRSNERKLVGNTPAEIKEDSKMSEVFFLVLEKENYKPKEIMVKVNEGESLVVAATLEPVIGTDGADAQNLAKKDDKDKPQPGSPKKDEPPKDWEKEMADMKLRIALLENTTSFYKDALFSPRLSGGAMSNDRDRRESVVSLVFQAQQKVAQGKSADALEKIDKALQLDEYSTNAWVMKGSIKYLMKDFNGARLAWEQTLKLDPYNKSVYKYLNTVYKMLNIEQMPEDPAALRYPASTLEVNKRAKSVK
jgi:tetratricopeptide (TPR) repeat protein